MNEELNNVTQKDEEYQGAFSKEINLCQQIYKELHKRHDETKTPEIPESIGSELQQISDGIRAFLKVNGNVEDRDSLLNIREQIATRKIMIENFVMDGKIKKMFKGSGIKIPMELIDKNKKELAMEMNGVIESTRALMLHVEQKLAEIEVKIGKNYIQPVSEQKPSLIQIAPEEPPMLTEQAMARIMAKEALKQTLHESVQLISKNTKTKDTEKDNEER